MKLLFKILVLFLFFIYSIDKSSASVLIENDTFFIQLDTIPPKSTIEYDTVISFDPKTFEEIWEIMTKEESKLRKEKIERHKKITSLVTFDPDTYKEVEIHLFKDKGESFKLNKDVDIDRLVIDTIYTYDLKAKQEIIWYRHGDKKTKEKGKYSTINPKDNCTNCPSSKKKYRQKNDLVIPESRTFIDKRDGQVYKWMLMEDGKRWMVQNLNFKMEGSQCPGNTDESCKAYGQLYDQKVILKVCPNGWRLPTDEDWWNLMRASPMSRGIPEYSPYAKLNRPLSSHQIPHISLKEKGEEIFNPTLAGMIKKDGQLVRQGELGIYFVKPNPTNKTKPIAYFFYEKSVKRSTQLPKDVSPVYSCRCIQDDLDDKDSDGVVNFEDKCPEVAGIKSNNGCPEFKTFIDSRDKNEYKYRKMKDGKFWMIQNLNYDGVESYCYYDKPENCEEKGRLYTYKVAQEVCPNGWQLPSDDDWWNLAANHGLALNTKEGKEIRKEKQAGKMAYSELIEGGSAGFDAILAGTHNIQMIHLGDNDVGDYWTSSPIGFFYRFKKQRTIHYPASLIRMHPSKKGDAKAVRCIKE